MKYNLVMNGKQVEISIEEEQETFDKIYTCFVDGVDKSFTIDGSDGDLLGFELLQELDILTKV